jgi:hypothetical protein
MPTSLSPFTGAEVNVKLREPQLTDGLNLKLSAVLPHGVYRGFKLATSTNAMRVSVVAAAAPYADHVANIFTTSGRTLTVHRASTFELNVTAYASSTIVIGLYGSYSTTLDTVAEIRAYTLAEFQALPALDRTSLVVLGQVVVPASGIIASSAITPMFRNEAWENTANGAVAWAPVVRNPSFEGLVLPSPANRKNLINYWDITETSGPIQFIRSSTSNSGGFSVALHATGAGTLVGDISQRIFAQVTDTKSVRIRVAKKILVAIGSGTLTAVVGWLDASGSPLTPSSIDLVPGSTNASFVVIDTILTPPTGAVTLSSIKVSCGSLVAVGAADLALIDDFQVWVEAGGALEGHIANSKRSNKVYAQPLMLDDSTGAPSNKGVSIYHDSTTPVGIGELVIDAADGTSTAPRLHAKGDALVSGLATIAGGLTSTGATTLSGGLTVSSGATVNGGLTLPSGSLATLSGGASITSGLTVVSGGVSVTAGGITVSSGGAAISGNSSFANNLTLTSGNLTISTGSLISVGGGTFNSGVTITAGGASITGGLSVDGYRKSGKEGGWLMAGTSSVSLTNATVTSFNGFGSHNSLGTGWSHGTGGITIPGPGLYLVTIVMNSVYCDGGTGCDITVGTTGVTPEGPAGTTFTVPNAGPGLSASYSGFVNQTAVGTPQISIELSQNSGVTATVYWKQFHVTVVRVG